MIIVIVIKVNEVRSQGCPKLDYLEHAPEHVTLITSLNAIDLKHSDPLSVTQWAWLNELSMCRIISELNIQKQS